MACRSPARMQGRGAWTSPRNGTSAEQQDTSGNQMGAECLASTVGLQPEPQYTTKADHVEIKADHVEIGSPTHRAAAGGGHLRPAEREGLRELAVSEARAAPNDFVYLSESNNLSLRIICQYVRRPIIRQTAKSPAPGLEQELADGPGDAVLVVRGRDVQRSALYLVRRVRHGDPEAREAQHPQV